MTEKKLAALTVISLMAVLAPACSFSFSTARIAEARMAKGVTEKMEPIDPTSTFETTDGVIHCLVGLDSAPEKTAVKAVWTVVNAQGQSPNEKIGETATEAGGEKNVVDFSYTPPPAGLPVGEYKVDIYLNSEPGKEEKPAKSLTFSVKAGRPMINEAIVSASEDGSPVTEFPAGTAIFYCTATVRGAAAGTQVSASWVAVETSVAEANQEIRRAPVVLEAGQNKLKYNLSYDGGFPPGKYRVDIYIGDSTTAAKSVTFTVAE